MASTLVSQSMENWHNMNNCPQLYPKSGTAFQLIPLCIYSFFATQNSRNNLLAWMKKLRIREVHKKMLNIFDLIFFWKKCQNLYDTTLHILDYADSAKFNLAGLVIKTTLIFILMA